MDQSVPVKIEPVSLDLPAVHAEAQAEGYVYRPTIAQIDQDQRFATRLTSGQWAKTAGVSLREMQARTKSFYWQ